MSEGQPVDKWMMARYVLVGIGSGISAAGVGMTDGEVQTAAGALVALASTAWGIYARWNTAAVPTDVARRSDVPVQSSATGKIREGPGV